MNQALAMVRPQRTRVLARPSVAVLPSFSLARIVARVSKEHPDWSQDRVQAAEDGYRNFLAKAKAEPKGKHSPSADVDEMWHAHILFTKQYFSDCNDYLGFYFHHEPFDETNRPKHQLCDGALKATDCQGGGDGCTGCGSGCSGGGTITAGGRTTRESAAHRMERLEGKSSDIRRCCGGGCSNGCGGCCESGGCSGGGH